MLSFMFPGGQDVTILVSKNGGRYRLQANCFEAMWLVLQVSSRPKDRCTGTRLALSTWPQPQVVEIKCVLK